MNINFSKELPLSEAYNFGIERNLQDEITAIQKMAHEAHPGWRESIRRGYIVELFMQKGIFESFKDVYWPDGNTKYGATRISNYLNWKKYSTPEGKPLPGYRIDIPPPADTEGQLGLLIASLIMFRKEVFGWLKFVFNRRK